VTPVIIMGARGFFDIVIKAATAILSLLSKETAIKFSTCGSDDVGVTKITGKQTGHDDHDHHPYYSWSLLS